MLHFLTLASFFKVRDAWLRSVENLSLKIELGGRRFDIHTSLKLEMCGHGLTRLSEIPFGAAVGWLRPREKQFYF
jgi:hypothetical protein